MGTVYKVTIRNPKTNKDRKYIFAHVPTQERINNKIEEIEDNTPICDLPDRGGWQILCIEAMLDYNHILDLYDPALDEAAMAGQYIAIYRG